MKCIICKKDFIPLPKHAPYQKTCGRKECKYQLSLINHKKRLKKINADKNYQKKEYELSKEYNDIPRNTYYCFRCEKEFKSRLPAGEAICVKCGSKKVSVVFTNPLWINPFDNPSCGSVK